MEITPVSGIATKTHSYPQDEAHKSIFEGIHFRFPVYRHEHPPVLNVNELADEQLTLGQKVADKVAATVGSWPFIIIQSTVLACWLVLNSVAWIYRWDPYPFILLNLALSFQAAYAAPFVMMSQNRQSEKDRLTAQNDYQTDTKGEEEIRHIMEHLDHQDTLILQIIQRLEAQHEEMLRRLTELDPTMAERLRSDIKQITEEVVESNDGVADIS